MTDRSRARLVRRLLAAADAKAARRLAAEAREHADEALSAELLDRFHALLGGELAKAEKAVRALAAVASIESGPLTRAHAKRATGVLSRVAGRLRPSATALAEAADGYRRCGRHLEAGDVARILVDVHTEAGDYRAARAAVRRAEREYERAGGADARRRASLAMHVGGMHRHAGRPDRALAAFDEARKHARRSRDAIALARADYNRANAMASLDRTSEARDAYRSARETFAENGLDALVAQCDYALAGIDLLEAELDRSLDLLDRVRRKQRDLGDRPGIAHCDIESADACLRLNRAREAEEHAARALAYFRRARQANEAADALALLAGAALQRDDPARARRLFRQARDVHRRASNPMATAIDDVGLARAETRAGRPARGVEVARRAVTAFRRLGLGRREARSLAVGAEAALAAGRDRLAVSWAKSGLELARRRRDARAELAALLVLAHVEEQAGRAGRAFQRLQAAERCVERLRLGVSSEESRLAFGADKAVVYERLVSNRLAVGTTDAVEQALVHAERGKARALAEHLARARTVRDPRRAPAAARSLVKTIDRLEHDIARAEARLEGSGDEGRGLRRRGGAPIAELLQRRHEALVRLGRKDADRAALLGAPAPDPRVGMAALDARDLALEYIEADGWLHLFAIRRDGVEAWPRLIRADALRDELDLLRFQLGKGALGLRHAERHARFVEASLNARLRRLHDVLLGPVAARLPGVRTLRIIPHGALHGLPFHSLQGPDGPVVAHHDVSYVPSLGVAGLLARRTAPPAGPSLVLGVPDAAAPAIEAEVAAIVGHLPDPRVYRGAEATREALRLSEEPTSVLHVACHGFFSDGVPGIGGLRLGDAWIGVDELYALQGTADLVVLSGCETGRGTVHAGDEWVGLVRGFLQAGARAVVAALWEVHDETAGRLMSDFHAALAAGRPVAGALADAQRNAMAEGAAVLQWAPFFVVGDPALTLTAAKRSGEPERRGVKGRAA